MVNSSVDVSKSAAVEALIPFHARSGLLFIQNYISLPNSDIEPHEGDGTVAEHDPYSGLDLEVSVFNVLYFTTGGLESVASKLTKFEGDVKIYLMSEQNEIGCFPRDFESLVSLELLGYDPYDTSKKRERKTIFSGTHYDTRTYDDLPDPAEPFNPAPILAFLQKLNGLKEPLTDVWTILDSDVEVSDACFGDIGRIVSTIGLDNDAPYEIYIDCFEELSRQTYIEATTWHDFNGKFIFVNRTSIYNPEPKLRHMWKDWWPTNVSLVIRSFKKH
ncbi:hypothetical protein F5Y12DRAFT_712677 [Xylaria sp. FL1777]|nr:hypothetical protein F5Y12DRAFT_712677 [Xylaria sp. FL1777]